MKTTKSKRLARCSPPTCSAGLLFKDAQTMRAVRLHEKLTDTWWCEGVDEEVGLWAYSVTFILSHSLPNSEDQSPQG
jgi:hypothetical protein